jgi:predicted O-methyltransferase YrrM
MRILEIGTGRGDGTLLLAAALPPDGLLIGMESNPTLAAEARERLQAAGHADRVSVIIGEPARFLHKVRGPFDVIVVHQLDLPREKLSALLRPGGMLIGADTKYSEKDMTIAEWLAAATADAEKRGLPELIPMLEGLAQATERLRAADWNDNPSTQPTSASALADFAQDKSRDDDQ